LNLSSILLKSVIANCDMETWAECEKHYFPAEYVSIWNVLDKYVQEHNILPSFEALQLSIRDGNLRQKFSSLELSESIDIDAPTLLEYLKNEYVQIEAMSQLDNYLDNIVAVESAAESIEALQSIVMDLEEKVDVKSRSENMQKMDLMATEEDLQRSLPLSLNTEYDQQHKFLPTDLILIGGRRGAGKSLTCANVATNMFAEGKSSIYFTIEMTAQSIMQRCCAIATGVPAGHLKNGSLTWDEWIRVAKWWSSRFENSERAYTNWLDHRNFRQFHQEVSLNPLKPHQLDIVYNPSLSLANIRTELDKKMRKLEPQVIIVDYINQVKRGHAVSNRMGQYDWTEQIEVSKALKTFAQEYNVPVISPYQIDASGEARFAKGILDAADAAFVLNAHEKKDNAITFECTKMRDGDDEANFTSVMDWTSLKMGPETAVISQEGESEEDVYEDIA